MTAAATVVAVFAMLLVGGIVLRQWSRRQVARTEEVDRTDRQDLADPSRWPAPPPDPSRWPAPPPDGDGDGDGAGAGAGAGD